jgi:hypothetical protein
MNINNLNELISYVNTNFNELTDNEFQTLLNSTLFIYPLRKPKTVIEAINMIKKYGNIPIENRPLFPDIKSFDNE